MTPPESVHRTLWGVLDIHRREGGARREWRRADSLTGDWGGYRARLEHEWGLSFIGSYTAEVAGNPIGGRDQNVRYVHDASLALIADLGTLVGLDDTYLLASMSSRAGNSNSGEDIGNEFAVQQVFGGETTRLVQLAAGMRLADDRLDLVAGRINGLDDFAASALYCNAQNLALCGNPLSIPADTNISSWPNTSWGARGRFQPVPSLQIMGGVYNAVAGFRANKFHGVDFSIRERSGVIGIGELALMPHFLPADHRPTLLPGHYKLGGYYDTEPLTVYRTGDRQRGTQGFYLGFDQMVWQETGDQGVVPFVTFHWAPDDVNQLVRFVSWGAVWQGLVPGRDDDILGFFGAWGRFSPDLRASQVAAAQPGQDYEMILELNYRWNVVPWFYLQPDIQGVLNPGGTGTIDDALVLALQFGVPL